MEPRTLLVQTVWFSQKDRSAARSLGRALYDLLTRPSQHRLAFGPGIPVDLARRWDTVDLAEAKSLLLVPVLGAATFQDEDARASAVERLALWSRHRPGSVVPVLLSAAWRAEKRIEVKAALRKLYADGPAPDSWTHTLIDVVHAAGDLLATKENRKLQLFISHAKVDLGATGQVAEELRDFIQSNTVVKSYFDATDLLAGHDLQEQLRQAAGQGVFLAVHTDHYSSRVWCERELLWAKQACLPTLTIEVLGDGELRSHPYAGNGPTLVWKGAADAAVLRALVEWVKARHFALEARRVSEGLPNLRILPRPPELLDLAQGPFQSREPVTVLYPDPEISAAERRVLRSARARIRLVTPSTLYRANLRRCDGDGDGEAPPLPRWLSGREVALSLSNSPDVDGPLGYTREHVDDAVVYLARSLISAGAAISYGGDFREDGFDQLLAQIIATYNETEVDAAQYLVSYLGATIPREKVPGLPITVRSLGFTPKYAQAALLPKPLGPVSAGRAALHFSDMRRMMALHGV